MAVRLMHETNENELGRRLLHNLRYPGDRFIKSSVAVTSR
jgi:hypothetical protein